MREIKFRGKRLDNGEWVYGDLLQGVEGDCYIIVTTENGFTKYEVQADTVGQYTGLKDKNGIEIFEGDIVKVNDDFDTYSKMAGEIRKIWYKSGGFRLKPEYESAINRGDRGCWIEDGTDFEVIGNIHDNP